MTLRHGALDDEIRGQLVKLAALPIYAERARSVGLDLGTIATWDQFAQIPLLTRTELEDCFTRDATWGGFRVPGIVRMNFTPSAQLGLLPELHTEADLATSARALAAVSRSGGVTSEDVVQITLAYHVLVAGRLFDEGFAALGACSVQAGAVPTEQQLDLARRARPTVLMSNPSFALRLGEAGLRGIRRMVLTGEPFTAIAGRREALKDAFDGEILSAIDTYGVSECFPVAAECDAEMGMHLRDDFCVTEVIDPETLEPVPYGVPGELVVSHRSKDAMPFLRYRTGDLAVVEQTECRCGATTVLPRGVFGRTDNMVKVKGVKLYPSQVAFILARFAGVDPRQFQITLSNRTGVDQLDLRIASTNGAERVDLDAIKRSLKEGTLLSFRTIELVPALGEGPPVVDLRGTDAAPAGGGAA